MQPSKYQQAILNWLRNGEGNGCCNAVAGSGKSTTLKLAAKALQAKGIQPSHIKVIVFGKANFLDLLEKFGQEWKQSISTLHSAGWSLLKQNLNFPKTQRLVRSNKYKKIAQELDLIARRGLSVGELKKQKALDKDADFLTLIDLVRLTNQEPYAEVIRDICQHFELPDIWEYAIVADAIARCLDRGERQARKCEAFDFTDMIWLPVRWGKEHWFRPRPYKFVLVDECQDLNAAQLELSLMLAGKEGRLLYCGDPHQAIMGFAGADCDSYSNIVQRVRALELPLSICYRCPRSHIELVRSRFPEISIEPRAEAPKGRILSIEEKDFWEEKSDGRLIENDMILCRKTAPLVGLCIKLISRGIAATVKGKAVGDTLKRDLEEIGKMGLDFSQLGEAIEQYRMAKTQMYQQRDNSEELLEQLNDKIDAIRAIYESHPQAQSIKDIEDAIDSLFSDDHSPIILSTVHRAKGLESDRVFILKPEDMPMTWRNQHDWQKEQENNILYVALTRSKSDLFVVGQPSWLLEIEQKKAQPEEKGKRVADSWECSECHYRNLGEAEACLSCGSVRFPLHNFVSSLTFEQKCELLELLEKEVNQEKAERVKAALAHDKLGLLSNRALAAELGFVSDVTVGKIRKQLLADGAIEPKPELIDRRGGKQKQRKKVSLPTAAPPPTLP